MLTLVPIQIRISVGEFFLWCAGWVMAAVWLLSTSWRIPKDKLDRSLETSLSIMVVLPDGLSERYLSRQHRRRRLVEINEFKEIYPETSARIRELSERHGFTEGPGD